MAELEVKDSPRLFISEDIIDNLQDKLHHPTLQTIAENVLRDANWLLEERPISEGETDSYQQGTRLIHTHLQCLTSAWALTHDPQYRKAALKHLGNILNWNHISCEAQSTTPPEWEFPFCLSYGEHAMAIAIMYDFFRRDITPDEKQFFLNVLDRFYMKEAVKCIDKPPWWAHKNWTNWNGVCAGAIGALALSFYTDHPEAPKLIPFVEKSLAEYFQSYIKNGGGSHEGTGYWNYGMNYAMRYGLSWESATGKKHPALEIPELAMSLFFPIDFTGLSFGDNDGWHPTCFYFALAHRLEQPTAALSAAAYLSKHGDPPPNERDRFGFVADGDLLFAADYIPKADTVQMLRESHAEMKQPVARIYKGLDWGILADDNSFPSLRLAVRGGSSKVGGHGMIDLLSFRSRINGELMITDQQDGAYMPTTFTKRGSELYGRSIASKSTLFVDGLGCMADVTCDKTEVVKANDLVGIRIDGSHIFLPRWKDVFIGRLFLLVENNYWLIVDHVVGATEVDGHWTEARFHTYAESQKDEQGVSLKSGDESMQMAFASLSKALLQESLGMPSQPQSKQTTIFRWMTRECVSDQMLVTGMIPGSKNLELYVQKEEKDSYLIKVTTPDGNVRNIRLTDKLHLKDLP